MYSYQLTPSPSPHTNVGTDVNKTETRVLCKNIYVLSDIFWHFSSLNYFIQKKKKKSADLNSSN